MRRGRVDTIRRGETSGGIKRVWRRYRYMKEKENCPMVPEEREREKERREKMAGVQGKVRVRGRKKIGKGAFWMRFIYSRFCFLFLLFIQEV